MRERGRLRVWSLLATVFGDIVSAHGGDATPAALREILGGLGVEPGALRTALSRLARDGWIERRRTGASVLVRLSRRAEIESRSASERIYSAPIVSASLGMIVNAPRGGGDAPAPWASTAWRGRIGPNLWLTGGTAAAKPPAGSLVARIEPGPLPEWALARLGVPDLARALRRLQRELARLERAIAVDGISPAAALSARVLLIHEWRRIALRLPPLPASALPSGWPAPACARSVSGLYRAFQFPSCERIAAIAGIGAPDAAIMAARWRDAGEARDPGDR